MSADVEFYIFNDNEFVRDSVKRAKEEGSSIFLNSDLFNSSHFVDVGHVSAVSYLGDEVPASVRMIDSFINENEVYEITDNLISRIMVAMNLPNRTMYKKWDNAGKRRKHMKNMLKSHRGKLLVSCVV